MSNYRNLLYRRRARTIEIVMNRPEQRNALSAETYAEMGDAVLEASADPEAKAITVTGAGKSFSSGGDLKEADNMSLDHAVVYKKASMHMVSSLLNSPKPVIAKVNGYCMAGGLILMCCCDLVVASEVATFSVPELLSGIADPYLPVLLPPIIGMKRARYLMLTAARIGALEAERWGLVDKVVPHDQLDPEADKMVDAVLMGGPVALATYKRLINANFMEFDDGVLPGSNLTAEATEGLRAFVEKRAPKWRP